MFMRVRSAAFLEGFLTSVETNQVGIRLTQVGPICSVWEWWKSIRVI
jgi:hypothetical protein